MEFRDDPIDFPMSLPPDMHDPPVTPPLSTNPSLLNAVPSSSSSSTPTNNVITSTSTSSSSGAKRSWVWNHFEMTPNGEFLVCKVPKEDGSPCHRQLNKDKSGSTKNMRNHLISIHKLTEPQRGIGGSSTAPSSKSASNSSTSSSSTTTTSSSSSSSSSSASMSGGTSGQLMESFPRNNESFSSDINFIPPSNLCHSSSAPRGPSLNHHTPPHRDQFTLKAGLAQMLKGGVIMDVTNVEQARIAEEAGAVAVMALERVPSDIRKIGGVARMSDPQMIKAIKAAVSIPVMAKVRIGHFVEAQILQALGVDYIDESEVLTPADPMHHIGKHEFTTPFVCGCRNLGEALRRIHEGAAMIRTKGEAGTGNVVEAVRHARTLLSEIRYLQALSREERYHYAKDIQAPLELLNETAKLGRLPVVNFAAGGIATPADAAMMMQLGMDGVFVGSGIFKSSDPLIRARAIVQAVTHFKDPTILAQVSENLGDPMLGVDISTLSMDQTYSLRGH